jgi:nitrite reductase/ring-hydroxylating ferredoxin subunit
MRIPLGPLADFPDRHGVPVQAAGRALAVFRSGEQVHVIDDRCAHRGFPLHDGICDGATVRCRTHGARYDLATGDALSGPATRGVRVYPAQIIDGEVVVDVE